MPTDPTPDLDALNELLDQPLRDHLNRMRDMQAARMTLAFRAEDDLLGALVLLRGTAGEDYLNGLEAMDAEDNPIQTRAAHGLAYALVEYLVQQDYGKDTRAGLLFDLLTACIEDFEKKEWPIE